MLKNQPIILGIDPGARQIGIAVLRGGELFYYAVKTLKKDKKDNSQSSVSITESLEQIICKAVEEFKVDCIALEKVTSAQQRNSFVEVVYRNVKEIAARRNFKLREYSPNFVRNSICRQTKATRREAYKILTEKYPELYRYLSATRIWQKAYFAHLFDAIAVALLCSREFEEAQQLSVE